MKISKQKFLQKENFIVTGLETYHECLFENQPYSQKYATYWFKLRFHTR